MGRLFGRKPQAVPQPAEAAPVPPPVIAPAPAVLQAASSAPIPVPEPVPEPAPDRGAGRAARRKAQKAETPKADAKRLDPARGGANTRPKPPLQTLQTPSPETIQPQTPSPETPPAPRPARLTLEDPTPKAARPDMSPPPEPPKTEAPPQGEPAPRPQIGQAATGQKGFYAGHFGFHSHPFALMPDPTLILWSRDHRRAFSVLEYGVVSGAPITLLTGGIGCGKTTLLRELLGRLDDTITVGLISNAQGGRGELVQWVLNALGKSFDRKAGYVALFQELQDAMIEEYAQGRRTLLIFDEAQNLSLESLEELRMLTNINTGKDVVLQLVLTGQPELRDMIRTPRLEQLAQRIAVSYDLQPLDGPTTAEFIRHRLKAAGGTGEEFDPAALDVIHEVTRGVPRLINQFCDISLLYAWTVDQHRIGPVLLKQVLEDNIFFAVQPPAAPAVTAEGQA